MAEFFKAYEISKQNEGGYVNDPDDPGGETYRGIARVYNPSWEGWAAIDAIKKKSGAIKKNWTDPALDTLAGNYYKTTYWDKLRLDEVKSQANANQMFDQLLDGVSRTIQMVKIALNSVLGINISIDSTMASTLIKDINRAPESQLFNKFKDLRTKRFLYAGGLLSPSDPLYSFFSKFGPPPSSGPKYVKGWLNRVNKYTFAAAAGGAALFVIIIGAFIFFNNR